VKNTIPAIFAAASLSLAAPAVAGSLSDPVVEPEVIAEDSIENASSDNIQGLLAMLTLVLIIVGKGA
jgi:hypothetical protein